jgi:hypothetical protein
VSAAIWWWLSFASEAGFLGIVIVRAPDMTTAIRETHRMGCNPGGEVAGWPVYEDFGVGDPPERFRDRLLTKEQAARLAEEWHDSVLVSTKDITSGEYGDVRVLDEPDNEGQ